MHRKTSKGSVVVCKCICVFLCVNVDVQVDESMCLENVVYDKKEQICLRILADWE